MAYSMNQVALYLNLAAKRVQADESLKYLTGNKTPKITGGGQGSETQILFVRDALWIANNDDADTRLQKAILDRLAIDTPDGLIDHVDAYQGRVFGRRRQGNNESYDVGTSPTATLLYELAGMDDLGASRDVPYPGDLVLPAAPAANRLITIGAPNNFHAPPVTGIVFIVGNYQSSNDAPNEHAEQKLLAALSRLPENIRGTLALYGCKRACNVCATVVQDVTRKLRGEQRYLNSRSHDDPHVQGYQNQFHAANIKSLDVDAYYP